MWEAIISGWNPPEDLSENEYCYIKNNMDEDKKLTAFAGFGCSFGAKFFGGYARSSAGVNYAKSSAASAIKKSKKMIGAQLYSCDYKELKIPEESLIYCDPPYFGGTKYSIDKKFNHEEFFSYCKKWKERGCTVFVSEYTAPDFAKCVMEINQTCNINTKKITNRTEKLFLI